MSSSDEPRQARQRGTMPEDSPADDHAVLPRVMTASSMTMTAGGDLEPSSSKDHEGAPIDLSLRRRPWRVHTTPWSRIVGHEYKGGGTASDPYVVTWLPEGDPENPLSFPEVYKWSITMMAATGTLAVSMGSSMLSAAVGSIKHDFPGYNNMVYIMVTGIYVLGFVAPGPFLWAPCSEVFGRRKTFMFTFVPFCTFCAAVPGAQTVTQLLLMRFFAGMFGCSAMTNSGGIIADMFDAHRRGLAMGVFAAMPFLGPVIGPIVGGFLSQASNWRWVGAVVAIFGSVLTLMQILLLPETYAPVILRQRAARISAATGRVAVAERDIDNPLDTPALFKKQLRVPLKLLFSEPIVFIFSLYCSMVFAILYMQFTSFPIVFQQHRGWSPGEGSLAFIGIAVGSNSALAWIIFFGNPAYSKKLSKEGHLPPEERLNSAIVGAIILPIGLFIFAWTCVPAKIHWIVPILACVPYGMGIVLVFLAVSNYLVDAYLPNAASVMAGGTVMRSILGVVFPLFTVDIYRAMGPNWASCLLAFIGLIFIPAPILLKIYGRQIRRLTKPGREADDLHQMMVHGHVPPGFTGHAPRRGEGGGDSGGGGDCDVEKCTAGPVEDAHRQGEKLESMTTGLEHVEDMVERRHREETSVRRSSVSRNSIDCRRA